MEKLYSVDKIDGHNDIEGVVAPKWIVYLSDFALACVPKFITESRGEYINYIKSLRSIGYKSNEIKGVKEYSSEHQN